MNKLYMVRKSRSLRLAAVGVLLMAFVLAPAFAPGLDLGPVHTNSAQASQAHMSAPDGIVWNAGHQQGQEQTLAGTVKGSQSALGQPSTPLGSMLNPDGTLNLSSSFSGSLDPTGWEMVSQKGEVPRFEGKEALIEVLESMLYKDRPEYSNSSPTKITSPGTDLRGRGDNSTAAHEGTQ